MRNRFILFLAVLATLAACRQKDTEYCNLKCFSAGATGCFSGYTAEEIDTVILKVFASNGLFDTLLSSVIIADTTSLIKFGLPTCYSNVPMAAGFDYEIFLPATNQTFRIRIASNYEMQLTPCNRPHPCAPHFAGAEITGGTVSIKNTIQPLQWFIELKK